MLKKLIARIPRMISTDFQLCFWKGCARYDKIAKKHGRIFFNGRRSSKCSGMVRFLFKNCQWSSEAFLASLVFTFKKNEWKVLNGLHFVRNDFRGFAHSKNFQVGSGSFIGFPIALAGLKRYQDASATAKMLKRPQPAPKGSRWP